MCKPSATSAIDPNSRPPMISTHIIAPHSQITAQVLRSLCPWSLPKKTCSWNDGSMVSVSMFIASSLQIGSDDVQQLFRSISVERTRMSLRIDQMRAHMVLHHFSHET